MKKAKKKTSQLSKTFPTFIQSIPHQKKVLIHAVRWTLYLSIGVFLFFNILLSQLVSPLYYQMMNENEKATVSYIQSLHNLPLFSSEFLKFKRVFGKGFENDIFAHELQQEMMIKNFEQILDKSPYSKDILYRLYLLYSKKGDKIQAGKYLKQAKELDPNLIY
ncbi:hypothetical protein HY041_03540 [Candidatus Roizmanbacteria bacterium]|nr:hypothetical protein [Candidatus Roizmanbacteria bacterium]